MHSIKENQEIRKLMILIFRYQQKKHRSKEITAADVDYKAKIVTKGIINSFIREIVSEQRIRRGMNVKSVCKILVLVSLRIGICNSIINKKSS
jgi:hypothetical protein